MPKKKEYDSKFVKVTIDKLNDDQKHQILFTIHTLETMLPELAKFVSKWNPAEPAYTYTDNSYMRYMYDEFMYSIENSNPELHDNILTINNFNAVKYHLRHAYEARMEFLEKRIEGISSIDVAEMERFIRFKLSYNKKVDSYYFTTGNPKLYIDFSNLNKVDIPTLGLVSLEPIKGQENIQAWKSFIGFVGSTGVNGRYFVSFNVSKQSLKAKLEPEFSFPKALVVDASNIYACSMLVSSYKEAYGFKRHGSDKKAFKIEDELEELDENGELVSIKDYSEFLVENVMKGLIDRIIPFNSIDIIILPEYDLALRDAKTNKERFVALLHSSIAKYFRDRRFEIRTISSINRFDKVCASCNQPLILSATEYKDLLESPTSAIECSICNSQVSLMINRLTGMAKAEYGCEM